MNKITRTREELKDEVLVYMAKNCAGFRNAKKKDNILIDINKRLHPQEITERTLRLVIAMLRKEKHLASHNSNPAGHWYIPLYVANDPLEIEAVLRSLKEKRSKALDMLNGLNQDIMSMDDKLRCSRGVQSEFNLTPKR